MFLRKFYVLAVLAVAVTGFGASDANAQATATNSANINALINNPIALNWVQDMDFGEAAPSTVATTIIVKPDGTIDPASTAIGTNAALVKPAQFSVSGLANQAYTVTLPDDVTVVLAGPGTSMPVTGFSHNATGTLSSAATQPDVFGVGATLNINADQTAGSYSGSFNVTVSYN